MCIRDSYKRGSVKERKKQYNKEYYSDKVRGKKHRSYCKAYYVENKTQLIEKQQKYYQKNLNTYKDYHKEYYVKHRARLLRYQKKYSQSRTRKKVNKNNDM